ncbi:hypothetical protein DDK22_22330 [Cupriavidus necator]|uniref:Uncharacterized protein n=1 Tax=Cupriavidus necator TaxID=106590 RepID=A0A367PGR6_CUPNE|nr:hypothetical protein DDK22_22330 [Cupriavidus necator]
MGDQPRAARRLVSGADFASDGEGRPLRRLSRIVFSPLPRAGEGPGERAGPGIPTRITSLTLQPSPPPLSRKRERGAALMRSRQFQLLVACSFPIPT